MESGSLRALIIFLLFYNCDFPYFKGYGKYHTFEHQTFIICIFHYTVWVQNAFAIYC